MNQKGGCVNVCRMRFAFQARLLSSLCQLSTFMWMTMKRISVLSILILLAGFLSLNAQNWFEGGENPKTNLSTFRPLPDWPKGDRVRSADGQPGPDYWQQRADYNISARLDTAQHRIYGSERITYHNHSPNALAYIWVQLDQNVRSLEYSRSNQAQGALPTELSERARQFLGQPSFDGGFNIIQVKNVLADGSLADADYLINNTVMKINLPEPLQSGKSVAFEIEWWFNIPTSGRGARELVRDGWLYEVAQWYPRVSVYDDVNGWQTDQFLGRGEFYLNFGNYDVKITVPWNHIVDGTGLLQNPNETLTSTQQERLDKAYKSKEPVFIIKADEVMTKANRPKNEGTITWHFKAENVRDFAWVSSKTYVWDAAGYTNKKTGKTVALHSIYPRDAMPLWDKVSTKSTYQTMETYGRMAFEYPYPKAVNVHGPVFGMEYPMIAFCGVRPDEKGNYTERQEYSLISVTIHEVGHNWFPMIVASDERTWTWMDEGLNSFLQYNAEQDWDPNYPSRRGPAKNIVGYMKVENQVPIMTQSDLISTQFGNNGYSKPAAGLVLLREQIVGPERFDQAFREYSQNWAFKHPQPYDFFRSIESGAGEDLAFFWRGWFYTTHNMDQELSEVSVQKTEDLLGENDGRGSNYYRFTIKNNGGLLLPVHLGITYADGSKETLKLPVDIWRNNEKEFTKGLFTDKEINEVMLDPDEVLTDVNTENNKWAAKDIKKIEAKESR